MRLKLAHRKIYDTLSTLFFLDTGIPTRRAFFGEGIGPVHLSSAGCTSEDTDLLDCAIDKSAVNRCDHSEDAGVICRGVLVCVCAMCMHDIV